MGGCAATAVSDTEAKQLAGRLDLDMLSVGPSSKRGASKRDVFAGNQQVVYRSVCALSRSRSPNLRVREQRTDPHSCIPQDRGLGLKVARDRNFAVLFYSS